MLRERHVILCVYSAAAAQMAGDFNVAFVWAAMVALLCSLKMFK